MKTTQIILAILTLTLAGCTTAGMGFPRFKRANELFPPSLQKQKESERLWEEYYRTLPKPVQQDVRQYERETGILRRAEDRVARVKNRLSELEIEQHKWIAFLGGEGAEPCDTDEAAKKSNVCMSHGGDNER